MNTGKILGWAFSIGIVVLLFVIIWAIVKRTKAKVSTPNVPLKTSVTIETKPTKAEEKIKNEGIDVNDTAYNILNDANEKSIRLYKQEFLGCI
jgi:flagellar biosynthesis/type III secretory pathway M-ring protein FliF/YscJ